MASLNAKLANIRAGRYTPADFIIADAKDGDMGFGRAAPGPDPSGKGLKNRRQYLDAMTEMAESGLLDILLCSASTCEILAHEGVFARTGVTPAVRYNDTTCIWSQRGGAYRESASRPFRTLDLSRVRGIASLGLYSVTFSNDRDRDLEQLVEYKKFRAEAAGHGLEHFLEVFNPAFDVGLRDGVDLGTFVNDCIVRALAGVTSADFPAFLKMVYNGPAALEELASYDPSRLVVGILGGGKGTTRDTFELVHQTQKYGGRVALFGRKINLAVAPVPLVRLMRG
ncbi:MAG: hypothetical protein R3F55_13865 [Alphaproteobacteria bacterium]